MSGQKLEVMCRPCGECLFTKQRITTPQRARSIVAECLRDDRYFLCHKGSLVGRSIVCASFMEKHGRDVYPLRLALLLDAVVLVDEPKESP